MQNADSACWRIADLTQKLSIINKKQMRVTILLKLMTFYHSIYQFHQTGSDMNQHCWSKKSAVE
ncbi:hypothetical protein A3195_18435 [Candidatus Thiodiazotropha endoloripes]|uniref:Uncharacterized protein n=1 Tax=Candidatus Thiodiazotropha endoloripes TaxID=1818881 RepID=A0A1E2UQL5_9GAMM|nr:hypothetical protein A3195_18435 [Candidatus Thiodiazotropha endoloripes]ODB87986.1 hypothetical protein A3193_03555 [Candidatus Thiodiazotropha endoloripes]ODB97066.1 hypothetical protein A3196_09970 [Candidatus Thiodiazotropha endoloripes]